MTRMQQLSERAQRLSGEHKKALRYLLPSGFPYNTVNFLIAESIDKSKTETDCDLLEQQIIHLENLVKS